MSERFKEILEEASKKVREWPEWKKSEDLKRSEQALASSTDSSSDGKDGRAKSAAAGK